MRSIGILLCLLSMVTCFGEDFKEIMIKEAPDVELADTLPENYDWLTYIDDADSVSEEMLRAWAGIKYLEPRLKVIHEECRESLKNNVNDLQKFEQIYALWVQADDVEVGWVSEYWEGGSQQKAAIPRAILRTFLRRIQFLQELRKDSGLFNQ